MISSGASEVFFVQTWKRCGNAKIISLMLSLCVSQSKPASHFFQKPCGAGIIVFRQKDELPVPGISDKEICFEWNWPMAIDHSLISAGYFFIRKLWAEVII